MGNYAPKCERITYMIYHTDIHLIVRFLSWCTGPTASLIPNVTQYSIPKIMREMETEKK